ncbi:hypothetical protein HN371_00625 [Candidatus Poribacteria bacterium]|jgi:mono/diheme cytochrome c family protein|nr:hypothetical protein [Candidatus Poribacteria bacterium]
MDYPHWDPPYLGGGMLIGIIAVLHVFVSHFAVGGGLFLALTERRAAQLGDAGLLSYVRTHSKFFLLLTVVFGAVSGVGIWFVIALVHPAATSMLIHTFAFGWAIEWCFFVVEIAAILIYYATWDRLDRHSHNLMAWIYFIAAFASLLVINGMLSFMLTPGKWLETRSFWHGFFNPSYLPSVIVRTAVTLALAGVYAMFTGARESDDVKMQVVPLASRWVLAAIPLFLVGGIWYQFALPELSLHIVTGGAPVVMMVATLSVLFSAILFPAVYFLGVRQPAQFTPAMGALLLVIALLATGVTEWVREAVRKPYIIHGYMYSNGTLASGERDYARDGYLSGATWASVRDFDPGDPQQTMAAGRELFRGQCQSCHTVQGFNGIKPLVYGWSREFLAYQTERLDELRAFMPPFVGSAAEKQALTAWLYALNYRSEETAHVDAGDTAGG